MWLWCTVPALLIEGRPFSCMRNAYSLLHSFHLTQFSLLCHCLYSLILHLCLSKVVTLVCREFKWKKWGPSIIRTSFHRKKLMQGLVYPNRHCENSRCVMVWCSRFKLFSCLIYFVSFWWMIESLFVMIFLVHPKKKSSAKRKLRILKYYNNMLFLGLEI